MNKEHLKELVKAHFNLVDMPETKETFGEVYDENKAFKFVFPGETLKVGDEVKVVTEEGQESLAPDGYHKLEDGTVIKTEGSSVTEISTPAEEAKEEEMSTFGADESISQVEGTTPQNETTETNPNPEAEITTEAEVEAEMMKKIKMAVDEAIASEIAGIKEEMAKMKAKFEEFAKTPATEKTMANAASKTKIDQFSATNDRQAHIMLAALKNKK